MRKYYIHSYSAYGVSFIIADECVTHSLCVYYDSPPGIEKWISMYYGGFRIPFYSLSALVDCMIASYGLDYRFIHYLMHGLRLIDGNK
jgi:hypothetical protein